MASVEKSGVTVETTPTVFDDADLTVKKRKTILNRKEKDTAAAADVADAVQHDSASAVILKQKGHKGKKAGAGQTDVEIEPSYLSLYRAALRGDWEVANEILCNDPNAFTAKLTRVSETVLHISVGNHHAIHFVKELVRLMPVKSLEVTDDFGRTPLSSAAIAGNIQAAMVLVRKNPDLPGIKNTRSYRPIHYAARYGHQEMVRYLLTVTKDEQGSFDGISGVNLLNLFISADFYGMALDLVKRNTKLVLDQDDNGQTAFQTLANRPMAFISGKNFGYWQKIVFHVIHVGINNFCFDSIRRGDVENPVKNHSEKFPAESIPCSVYFYRFSSTYGVFWSKPRRIFWLVLRRVVPWVSDIHDAKVMHVQALELSRLMCQQAVSTGKDAWKFLEEPLRSSARLGSHEFVVQILKTYPELIWSYDNEYRHSIFHIAVLNRHEKIFSLIYQNGCHTHPAAEMFDRENNNILHLAGMLGPSTQVSGAALQMQRELLWFKEVEKCVQPSYKEKVTKTDKLTPKKVFTAHHKNLVEKGEEWMKTTASSCSVVAALIVTVVFAAAFTVPGGYNDNGAAILLNEVAFMVFCISDAIGLFSSSTSVLMFLGILTSRYSEEDFLVSLPRKLIIGLLALFISIASMVVAFSAAFYIILVERFKWILIPIALLGFFPVALFARLQFPLLLDIYSSTYGSSIFQQKGRDYDHLKQN